MFQAESFIADRMHSIDASGIRRVFDLAATLKDPVNLSIGQPDFDVPDAVKEAAVKAIQSGFNRYTVTQGIRQLQDRVTRQLADELPDWTAASPSGNDGYSTLITSGVSGGLMLAILSCIGPGDEVLMADPCFVMYRHLVTLAGGKSVYVDTYPDFQLTAARIEPHITPKTRMLLFNTPANPTGIVASIDVCRDVAELCRRRNILLVSDEIYDEFCYAKTPRRPGQPARCPTPADFGQEMLLLRGFSKTYAMTGWRLGWAAGPKAIVDQMTKLQQYSFVCAPSMAQLGGVTAMDVDMSSHVRAYQKKRDLVVQKLQGLYQLSEPHGAFYAFPQVPERLGLTATQFVEKAIAKSLLIIPGSAFSQRDTHFRISYACNDAMLTRGLEMLQELACS